MKKILPVVALATFASLLLPGKDIITSLKASELSDSTKTNLINNLTHAIRLDCEVNSSLFQPYELVLEVDDSHTYRAIYDNGEIINDAGFIKDAEGNAHSQYLDVSNEILSEVIMEDEENAMKYDGNFDHLFLPFNSITATTFDKYFSYTKTSDTITYTLTDLGHGLIHHTFSNFFVDLDGYFWDEQTLAYKFSNVLITSDIDGLPKTLQFIKTKSDRYGGYKDRFTCNLSIISSTEGLKPYVGKLTNEEANILGSALNNLQSNINCANFIQSNNVGTDDRFMWAYNTYYDFARNAFNMANCSISDLALQDSAGATYISIVETVTDEYMPYAFTPTAPKYQALGQETYKGIASILPNPERISTDFYENITPTEASAGTYEFKIDFAKIRSFDITFAEKILNALFGGFDPMVTYGGIYVYDYDYIFDSLTVSLENNEVKELTLRYMSATGQNFKTVTTYSNFNQVDVLKASGAVGQIAKMIQNIYLGGE